MPPPPSWGALDQARRWHAAATTAGGTRSGETAEETGAGDADETDGWWAEAVAEDAEADAALVQSGQAAPTSTPTLCGQCVTCLDKIRFGGPGIKRKACLAIAKTAAEPLAPMQSGRSTSAPALALSLAEAEVAAEEEGAAEQARPRSLLACTSSGRVRVAPQRLDASVLAASLYGKYGSARGAARLRDGWVPLYFKQL